MIYAMVSDAMIYDAMDCDEAMVYDVRFYSAMMFWSGMIPWCIQNQCSVVFPTFTCPSTGKASWFASPDGLSRLG